MATYILAGYIVFLLLGGLMGYLKAGSKVSLLTALVSAAVLAVCGYGPVPRGDVLVAVVQGILVAVFVARFLKTRKFLPAGLMVIVTVLALVLGLVVKS